MESLCRLYEEGAHQTGSALASGNHYCHGRCGLLRARESLFLLGRDLIDGPCGFVTCLGPTERSVEERVVVSTSAAVRWLRAYLLVVPEAR